MNIESTLSAIEYASNKIKELTEQLRPSLTDKSIPLDQRWEMLTKHDFGEQSYDCDAKLYIVDKNLCLYDDFYVERYQTQSYGTIYETLVEMELDAPQSKLDEWREAILAEGCSNFTNDW